MPSSIRECGSARRDDRQPAAEREQSAVLGLSAMSTVHGLARVLDDMVDTWDGAAR